MANLELATLGNGCFWCTEAVFQRLKGVVSVTPGYSGGDIDNPSYEQVSSGTTSHAEVAQIEFDPDEISYRDLLEIYWKTHDPTTPNRQGADVGTQYRSIIFYHSDEQQKTAESLKAELDSNGTFSAPIVTHIEKFQKFFPAEDYHLNYYNNNPNAGYCKIVIDPKVKKLISEHSDKIKKEYSDTD
ncbi:peptide-methionine (S)-S-oxide reductase MsrA [Candidatus Dojkabacteria bacterium]|uniref:Peptide methionine sulfoxide reductase MsrA n=1 Tax=Candidatus Dojkabacteria bacterium TaxID=2099670 RepID=A0A955L5K1_9BACT|nr:peptide-methionine (S)-S-oxide reductase MsrA [Candidatus Dojkabacteria bacterium]